MSAAAGVLAVLDEAQDWLYRSSESRGDDERAEAVKQARAVIAELIEADKEYDAAIAAAKELNRKIAESGWLEVEFDALRKSGDRVVKAQMRRADALASLGGAA